MQTLSLAISEFLLEVLLKSKFAPLWVFGSLCITTEKVAHDLAPLTEICATYVAELRSSLANRNTANLSVVHAERMPLDFAATNGITVGVHFPIRIVVPNMVA